MSAQLLPTQNSLRRLLDAVLVTDADFEAFCFDYFPEVAKRFGVGNDRVQKTTLLLRMVDHQQILQRLRDSYPELMASRAGLLEYAAPPLQAVRKGHRGGILLFAAVAVCGMAVGGTYLQRMRRGSVASTRPAQTVADQLAGRRQSADGGEPATRLDAGTDGMARTVSVLKIIDERQRKNAFKLSAPVTSVEKFLQNAIDIGESAELVTYKKLDPKQKQWVTHVILLDSRSDRPVSMIIYSEEQYRSWISDTSSMGETLRDMLRAVERKLSEIPAYQQPASLALQLQWIKDTLARAKSLYRVGAYDQAASTATLITKVVGASYLQQMEAWQIVGLAGCASKQPELAKKAMLELSGWSASEVRSACSGAGFEWNGAGFTPKKRGI